MKIENRSYWIWPLLLSLCVLLGCASKDKQPPMHWYKGSLHAHSDRTGADVSPEDVIGWYFAHGYDFCVLTDHDLLSPWWGRIDKDTRKMLVIPGEEVSVYEVHIGAIGVRKQIDGNKGALSESRVEAMVASWRSQGKSMDEIQDTVAVWRQKEMMDAVRADIRAQGGLAVLNHPAISFMGPLFMLNSDILFFELRNPHQEVYYPNAKEQPDMEKLWDQVLTSGRRILAVGGDDGNHYRHYETKPEGGLYPPGMTWVMVRAPELSEAALYHAMRQGDFYVSTGVTLKRLAVADPSGQLEIEVSPEDEVAYKIDFIGSGGRVLKTVENIRGTYVPENDEKYVRVRVSDSTGKFAYTQPVFLNRT